MTVAIRPRCSIFDVDCRHVKHPEVFLSTLLGNDEQFNISSVDGAVSLLKTAV